MEHKVDKCRLCGKPMVDYDDFSDDPDICIDCYLFLYVGKEV